MNSTCVKKKWILTANVHTRCGAGRHLPDSNDCGKVYFLISKESQALECRIKQNNNNKEINAGLRRYTLELRFEVSVSIVCFSLPSFG